MNDVQTVLARCRKAGMRTTPQRMMVIEILVGNQNHPTAEEIYQTVRETYPYISVATVYNTLNMLARMGEITLFSAGGIRHFDPDTGPHDHAVCTKCGRLYDVARKKKADTELMVGNRRFTVSSQQTVYYGVCQECTEEKQLTVKEENCAR